MKLHLGCGTIYLKDYINIDASPHFIVPNVEQELLNINTTTIENYYKHNFCEGSGICIVDIKSEINNLPFNNEQINEVVLIQILEHIPYYNLDTLWEINRVLKIGGSFIVGVPDIKETAKILSNAKNDEEEDWAIRLIYGTQRNQWSHHFCGYNERILKQTLSKYGFGNFQNLPNINFYPSVYLKAFKLENK